MTVAERIRQQCLEIHGLAAAVSTEQVAVSMGVSCYPDCAGDLTALFASADAALYAAKEAGRNCVIAAPRLQATSEPPKPPR